MKTAKQAKKALALLVLAAFLPVAGLCASAEEGTDAIAADFTKTEAMNTSIYFSTQDFEENFSASDKRALATVKILTIPDAPDAQFKYSDTDLDVTADTEIPADQLSTLYFKPGTDWTGTTSFTYQAKAADTGYSNIATVNITVTPPSEGPLVVEDMSFTTKKNTPYTGQLVGRSTDSIPSEFTFQIGKAPTKGKVEVTDVHTGAFTYTPFTDQLGDDEFTFHIAYAPYQSREATVSINIEDTPEENLFHYADLGVHWAAYSAAKLVERDVTVGEKIGNQYFYYPERQLTRGDMILLMTAAVGLDGLPEWDGVTRFADHDTIPDYLLEPAYRALQAGIIQGVEEDGLIYLYPNATLTRVEVLMMMNNAINPDAQTEGELEFADAADIPAWAVHAVKNLEGYGLLKGYDDNTVRPYALITKAQGGELTYQLIKYLDAYPSARAKLAGMVVEDIEDTAPVSYDINKGYLTVEVQ